MSSTVENIPFAIELQPWQRLGRIPRIEKYFVDPPTGTVVRNLNAMNWFHIPCGGVKVVPLAAAISTGNRTADSRGGTARRVVTVGEVIEDSSSVEI